MDDLLNTKPRTRVICIITPSFNIGGIERTVIEIANFLVLHGHKVILISLLSGKKYFKIHDSIQIIEPTKVRSSIRFLNALYRLWLIKYLRDKLKLYKPYTILSMSDTFNPVVILSSLKLPLKVVIGDVTKPGRKFPLITHLGKKILYPVADLFIAQTNFAAGYYTHLFKSKLKIKVVNGAVKPINKVNTTKKKIILCVGRLSYEKGQDRLIHAFSQISDKKGWKVVFTANGPLRDILISMVKEKNLENEILFLGNVEDIDRLYSEAGIFVLPSRSEGFPNALTEAMAFGLPCICFDSFPSNEIISNNTNGIILPDEDILALSNTLEYLMDNEDERNRLGAEAAKIVDKLSIDKIGYDLMKIIAEP